MQLKGRVGKAAPGTEKYEIQVPKEGGLKSNLQGSEAGFRLNRALLAGGSQG